MQNGAVSEAGKHDCGHGGDDPGASLSGDPDIGKAREQDDQDGNLGLAHVGLRWLKAIQI
jgi:hypothetical protein